MRGGVAHAPSKQPDHDDGGHDEDDDGQNTIMGDDYDDPFICENDDDDREYIGVVMVRFILLCFSPRNNQSCNESMRQNRNRNRNPSAGAAPVQQQQIGSEPTSLLMFWGGTFGVEQRNY